MKLAGDERGRVPFALVGVLLLVTSGAYVTALGATADADTDVPAARTAEDARSVARSALVRATRGAARDAARRPLVAPANTTVGHAVERANGSAFRSGLELRTALAARDALNGSEASAGGVTANVSLDATGAAALVGSVTTEVRADGDRIAVSFQNLSVTLSRDGRRISERAYSPTVVVHTPAFALHERTENFTEGLRGGYLDDGLPRSLTTRLHGMAWARGYAQYGGAPVVNVLANRHVALAANGALLDAQREAFGAADADSRRALGDAAARTGVRDLVSGVGSAAGNASQLGPRAGGVATEAVAEAGSAFESSPPTPVVAGVNRSADEAYLGTLDGRAGTVLDSVFGADARRTVRVSAPTTRTVTNPAAPANATLIRTTASRSTRVERGNATLPDAPAGFESVGTRERRVVVTETTTRFWAHGDTTETTEAVRETTYRVGLRATVRYGHTVSAPSRGFADPEGSVYAAVPERARQRLLAAPADTARRAVTNGTAAAARSERLAVGRPAGIRGRVVANVTDLHQHARNVSVNLPPSAVAEDNPAARLATRFDRFAEHAGAAPTTYPDAATKAEIAVRRAYLNAVAQRLRIRSESAADISSGVTDALGGALPLGETPVSSLLTPDPLPGNRSDLSVRARPAYLSLSKNERTGTYPLAARNTNIFSVPYGDAADSLVDAVLGGGEREYSVGTAARALAAANDTSTESSSDELAGHRETLRRELAAATAATRLTLVDRLADAGMARGTARGAVESGLTRWETVHTRALALANGSAAGPVAAAVWDSGHERNTPAAMRDGGSGRDTPAATVSRAEIAAEVRLVLAERRTVSLPEAAVSDTVGATRSEADALLREAARSGMEEARGRVMERLPKDVRSSLAEVPSGLPVAPVPGHWYATVNVWDVAIEGGYRNVSVRAPTGNSLHGSLAYTREDAPVRLDTDGDGTRELVGRNLAPTFDVRTGVAVVVPPGSRGVGDGVNADERSAGWD